jgi:hypothetical protein
MSEIAIPMNAAPPRRLQGTAVRARLLTLIAGRPPRAPSVESCCFGRMSAKDTIVARGLAAAAVAGQAGPAQ